MPLFQAFQIHSTETNTKKNLTINSPLTLLSADTNSFLQVDLIFHLCSLLRTRFQRAILVPFNQFQTRIGPAFSLPIQPDAVPKGSFVPWIERDGSIRHWIAPSHAPPTLLGKYYALPIFHIWVHPSYASSLQHHYPWPGLCSLLSTVDLDRMNECWESD